MKIKKKKRRYGELSKIFYFLTFDDSLTFIYNLYNIPLEEGSKFLSTFGLNPKMDLRPIILPI